MSRARVVKSHDELSDAWLNQEGELAESEFVSYDYKLVLDTGSVLYVYEDEIEVLNDDRDTDVP